MADKKLYKSKSDYTIRRKHLLSTQGDIYESDHLTISPMDELFSDQIPIFSDSIFKFSIRKGNNMQRKHSRGNWLKRNDNGNSECGDLQIWTSDCLNYDFISPETEIKLKPNYNSIKDFAYYGSAIDLIKSTINNVIMYFPSELYFSDIPLTVNGKTYYIIENDFEIDVYNEGIKESNVLNPTRYFCLRHYDYDVIDVNGNNTSIDHNSWQVSKIKDTDCEIINNGGIISKVEISSNGRVINIYVYFKNGEITLLSDTNVGYRIRPNKNIIEKYYSEIDDFENLLVNRTTKPLYKAIFDTPYETDYGVKTRKIEYVWPNAYGWNPKVKGSSFEIYYDSLMELAEYHDEYDSNNIWRSMTHEAIKNLDWTFVRDNGNSIDDMSIIDTSKILMMINLYGRQYDDLKRYIDNIRYTNNVSYDEKNNIPDYCLTDLCNNYGFEITNLNINSDNSLRTEPLYSGVVNGYNTYDANTALQRRLKINSNYLMSIKGTVTSIGTIMGLLGFDDDEYEIKEHICIAEGETNGYNRFISGENKNTSIKYPLADDIKEINKERNDATFNMQELNPYKGLPLREVTLLSGNSYVSYVIPWFSKKNDYDGGLYFQMYGGWGKQKEKTINLSIAPDIKKIDGDKIYDETESYLKYARTLTDMLEMGNLIVKTGDICYVTDMSDIIELYKTESNANLNIEAMSNYFILENDDLSGYLGYSSSDKKYGWKNILVSEFTNITTLTPNGEKVLYLESIIDETKGNNPHIGRGNYDDGKEYLERMSDIFGYAISNNLFTKLSDEEITKIGKYKFNLRIVKTEENTDSVYIEDNKKCWYFDDTSNDGGLHAMRQDGKTSKYTTNGVKDETLNISINPFNPEGGESYDEAAANSIINTKYLSIVFKPNKKSNDMKQYIIYKVLPYVKQMIPSTTIFEYKIDL